MDVKSKEVQIPAPWGHIAAKCWGDEEDSPVIVTHGMMDNAGSFDRLIPLLPKSFYYICVDLPGHGLSSHFHLSLPIHATDFLPAYKMVVDFFDRQKYILLGHSFGGGLSMVFAQLYPQHVTKLIILDVYYLIPFSPEVFIRYVLGSHETLFKMLNSGAENVPTYTYKTIVEKIKDSRFLGELTWETAEDIARRMIKRVGEDQYVITFDQRLKYVPTLSAHWDYVKELLKRRPIQCAVYTIATPSISDDATYNTIREIYAELNFKIYNVGGHHHVHSTNPEVIASLVTKLLLDQNSKF